MNDKLKPCPFCGGEADVSIGHNGENEELIYVECVSCAGMANMYKYRAEAITAWNARTKDPQVADLQAEVKRLEGEIKKLKKDMKDAGLLTEEEFNKWMAEQALKEKK
ncbi:MAG TPA: Lar family restriction alleviation protein [Desulfosporosinus sp.]|nr:Lar family restriction alleviation protein [Desulfosporosinus sp.]